MHLVKGFTSIAGAPKDAREKPTAILMGGGKILALLSDSEQVIRLLVLFAANRGSSLYPSIKLAVP